MFFNKITDYYNRCFKISGNNVHAVGWFSERTQQARFEVLAEVGDLSGCSVLDVGSGLGDFYKFMSDRYPGVNYTGVDIAREFVRQAQKNYPGVIFIKDDVLGLRAKQPYDYVVSSGAFNLRVNDNYDYLRKHMLKMFDLCSKGLALNVLSKKCPPHLMDSTFFYYDPDCVLMIAKSMADKVILRQEYLPNDMTVIMKK